MRTKVLDKLLHLVDKTDALIGRLFALCMYRNVGFVVLVAIYFIGMLPITPFPRILHEDAYAYVEKALEILSGDFTPPPRYHIGWPLMLAPVFALLQIDDLFTAMFAARWLSFACVLGSFIMIYVICKRLIEGHNKYQIAAIAALCTLMSTAFCTNIVRQAYSEPAFLLFNLISIYFLVDARATIKSVILATIFASLSYYVRPNGLFSIGAIALFLLTRSELDKTMKVKWALGAILVFFVVSAPHMISRYQTYGSVFSYGENSKILVDSSAQLWAPSIKAPTLVEYVKKSSFPDYYEKFIVKGLWQVLKTFYSGVMLKLWIIVFIASFIKTVIIVRDKKYDVFYVWILVSLLGLSMVFHVFKSGRHLIYLMPVVLIVSFGFFSSMDHNSRVKFSNIVLLVILIFNVSWMPRVLQPIPKGHLTIPEVIDDWAIWGAQHLEGKVAIVEGGNVLKISQHYSEFTPERKIILPFDQVDRKISYIRPGNYQRLEDALAEFKQLGIQYVITDGYHIKRRSYLRELKNEEWACRFQHLKYFKSWQKGSVLHDVNIYKVNFEGECP